MAKKPVAKKPKTNTREALRLVMHATWSRLAPPEWQKFKQLPPTMQAHLLCEGYLATLRERTLPGKAEVETNTVSPKERAEPVFTLAKAALLEAKKAKAQEVNLSEQAKKVREAAAVETSPARAYRVSGLGQAVRAFYHSTQRLVRFALADYPYATIDELQKAVGSRAGNVDTAWAYTTSDATHVTLTKLSKTGLARRSAALARLRARAKARALDTKVKADYA